LFLLRNLPDHSFTSSIFDIIFLERNSQHTYSQQFGSKQQGGFIDIVQPILNRTMLDREKATLNVDCRLEYIDWNVVKYNDTDGNIGEDLWSVVSAISFRPNSQTVIRLNYRLLKQRDILLNPPSMTDGFNFRISTYF
ncbi:MAG: hypothetical protein Q8K02_09785, partial [Flavobacterium sp.]|nr:hypothetical protein [Flavobacterium sp.]